ncbi:hypothetical protein PIB30_010313 [Stylosanthes scabra]|uniref:Uncharacterized protein n=1 Tax=Stylosanthes scabra TaxID=79078 RepID=A0ABU6U806_9FABA|nr:hypothetical protein [Stylosanthes scabra]
MCAQVVQDLVSGVRSGNGRRERKDRNKPKRPLPEPMQEPFTISRETLHAKSVSYVWDGNSGGRGPRPRVKQPPPPRPQSEGWYPFGMPPNFQPQVIPSSLRGTSPGTVQLGSMPNEQPFSEISRSVVSPNVNQPLSTVAMR